MVVLGKIRIKKEDIMDYLIAYDTTKLTASICQLLLPILPTEQEILEVQAFEGDYESLMDCDQFFFVTIKRFML